MNLPNISPKSLYLIGYRGTGKTALGQKVAGLLRRPFFDTDELVVKDMGKTIADSVAENGWEYFRETERLIIERLGQNRHIVVATGGGVVLNPNNIYNMKRNGIVIWLKAKPETIISRMKLDSKTDAYRPSLSGKDVFDEVYETLSERTPLYENASDIAIPTDNTDLDELCRLVIRNLETAGK